MIDFDGQLSLCRSWQPFHLYITLYSFYLSMDYHLSFRMVIYYIRTTHKNQSQIFLSVLILSMYFKHVLFLKFNILYLYFGSETSVIF